MHFSLPSRFALVATGCALASAIFWGWSRGLPEPNWESSSTPLAAAPSTPAVDPLPEPGIEAAVPPSPHLSPKPEPRPEPQALTPAVVQTEPEPIPPVPPTTPTPDPSPIVAAATPASEPSQNPETSAPVPPVEPTPTPVPAPPRPSDDELAGPLPEHSPGEKAVVASATPIRLEIGDIASQPRLWPPQVLLLVSQRFPVVIKGVNVGNVQVPAGRPVVLRKVHTDGTLEIEFQGSPTRIKAQATDLLIRATALAAREKAGSGE